MSEITTSYRNSIIGLMIISGAINTIGTFPIIFSLQVSEPAAGL